MAKVALKESAPDFELEDFRGAIVRLSAYKDDKHIVLVFNRGFV